MTQMPQMNAQSVDGQVSILPAVSSADVTSGPFSVAVRLDGLQHEGSLGYDDDRDTVADREEASVGLGAFEFILTYDPNVLEVEDIRPGTALGTTGRSFQCLSPLQEAGKVRFGCISTGSAPPGAQGSMTLATVAMRPVAPGTSALALEANLAGPLGSDVPVAVSGGEAFVTGESPSAGTTGSYGGAGAQQPGPAPLGPATFGSGSASAGVGTPSAGDEQARNPDPADRNTEAEREDPGRADGNDGSAGMSWLAPVVSGAVVLVGVGFGAALWQRRRRSSAY
jgi:hypothetical protein